MFGLLDALAVHSRRTCELQDFYKTQIYLVAAGIKIACAGLGQTFELGADLH
jgi:hypothetical protein